MGTHDKYHNSVGRNPDGSYYYIHGAFLGHVVPGTFFIVWGTWWMVAGFQFYLVSLANKQSFKSRSWYRWPWAPRVIQQLPLEPIVKVVLPSLGILGELWAGHESYRQLLADNGTFQVDNLNDWQHSTMYLAFVTSGVVDLLGHFTQRLPAGTEHGFLSLAFVVQLLLLVFHLKGPGIEIMVHLILALQARHRVAGIVVATFAEVAHPQSILMASVRPYLTILQGVWWIQTAYIMYVSDPKWDPDSMAGTMMAPVVLAVHMLWIAFASLSVLLVMRVLYERVTGRALPLPAAAAGTAGTAATKNGFGPLPQDDSAEVVELDVEMSALMGHKHQRVV
ncbi:hypothetical protein N2152v2_000908 [Parachlorella kessleri]